MTEASASPSLVDRLRVDLRAAQRQAEDANAAVAMTELAVGLATALDAANADNMRLRRLVDGLGGDSEGAANDAGG